MFLRLLLILPAFTFVVAPVLAAGGPETRPGMHVRADVPVVTGAFFERRTGGAIGTACAAFRAAEANAAVVAAVAATPLSQADTGVAGIKAYADRYCAMGPPPDDTTTATDQANWVGAVSTMMVGAAQ